MPKFTISIAVHNLLESTRSCINSILASGGDWEAIITDNGSTDGTAEYLRSLDKSRFRVITNPENLGFIIPHNRALTLARGDFFVVLNNDIQVVPGWLDIMAAEFARNPNLAICGVLGGCNSLSPDGRGILGDRLEYVEGSCLMIPTALARKHGLFANYLKFAYYEDSDLSLRMRQAGYDIALAPVFLKHQRRSTSDLVRREGKINLDSVIRRNHLAFRTRWKRYLRTRTFAHRVLVRRTGAIGDVFLLGPVLKAVRKRVPRTEITVCTLFPEIFRGNPDVHRAVLPSELNGEFDETYDLDLAYERRPKIPVIQAYAEACRVKADGLPMLYTNRKEEAWADQIVPVGGKVLAIHPGPTAWEGRNWPLERFSEVSLRFQSAGWKVLLVGSPGSPVVCDLDLRGKTTVHSLASVLRRCSAFVGIDSFPMHVAVSVNIPVVAVFGCILPELRIPQKSYFRGVQATGLSCLGCHHRFPPPVTVSRCRFGNAPCMSRIGPDQVIDAVVQAVSRYEEAGERPNVI